MNQQALSSLIWSVADLLRGDFKQSEYGRVILLFTVLRRLKCVLEPTKAAALAEVAAKRQAGIAFEPFVKRKTGLDFYNVSSLDMGKLMGDQDNIRANLDSYIEGFAPDVRSIFEPFDFAATVERLHKARLLYLVTEKFARIDLHAEAVDHVHLGLVFEELIRKFAELSNETDIAAYVRLYGFLSQIFDCGNTDVEKRSIFFRLLYPLLSFGREREGVDLSALRLTAYTIKSLGDPQLNLAVGEPEKLYVVDAAGSGQVQDKTKVTLAELIEKVNDLFVGDLSPGDKLVYVNDVIKSKLMESERLAEQALNNTKVQFASSPDLAGEIMNGVMDALAAHTEMSKQALESEQLRSDMKNVLLGAGRLWEGLREKAGGAALRG